MAQLRSGFVSITGNFRDNNEDRCLVDPKGRYFLVCDGMGGQAAGEKASEMAAEIVPRQLEQTLDFENATPEDVVAAIDQAVAEANSEIMAMGNLDPSLHQMGTTIVFLVEAAGSLYAGGVGDSRVYLLRGDDFTQLTVDHSLTQALVDAGTINAEEAASHRYRNVLYRYLGTREGGTGTSPRQLEIRPGDRFLLCTDGVTDGTPAERLLTLLRDHDDPQAAAEAIVQAAEEGGSKDNITCVVTHVLAD